uniref:Ribosomal protein S6 kinase like 1 n=1 Tax=Varanus komodoensis TaxID=61221 RepID=A0A8D2LM36_VARKO
MSCTRAFSQARVYLEQIRSRVAPGAVDIHGTGKRDYLVDAAKQIRLALERDVSEDYEEAFNHYKNGVDVLLNGVQVEPNKERREAVKRKITQYLKRAEEIFICHLQRNLGNGNSTETGYSSLRFRPIRTLSTPVENLKRCKVVGIIDKVQLVQDPATGGTFILKSLPKSHVETRERQTIIPHGIPFMAELLCYSVSEDSIFLHLEHVKGGTLWCHLHSQPHLQSNASDSSHALNPKLSLALGQTSEESFVRNSQEADSQCGGSHLKAERRQLRDERCFMQEESILDQKKHKSQLPSEHQGFLAHLAVQRHSSGTWNIKEDQIQVWAAELILALEGLHQQGVLCQDLNPRNLLLDDTGHIRLTYFGQWSEVERQCCTQALEDLYCAPEVGGISELTEACDWWSFGALLYELLSGTSLAQNHPSGIHPHTQLHLPERLSHSASSLLSELLQYEPNQRLGSGEEGVNKIKSHPFFSTIQWNKLVAS